MKSIYSAGWEYDAETWEDTYAAIQSAKLRLGQALQARGILTEITYVNGAGKDTGRPNPQYAGEIAATKLNIGQRDLANAMDRNIEKWARAFENGLPLLVRLNAVMADIKSERALAATGV